MTLERPMFPPVDPTRRRFLTLAAVGGVATLAPAIAQAAPAKETSPALQTAIHALNDAHERLTIAQAASDAANDLFEEWERQNPSPESKKGRRRWIKKARAYHLTVTPKPWQALMDAEREYAAAQIAVANTPIAGTADMHAMATCSVIYDGEELARGNRAPIAQAVALECFRRGSAVQS